MATHSGGRKGPREHYILEKLLLLDQTFDFSPELLSLHLEEKLIELCPGYDAFFFPPPSMEVLQKCPPQGFEIHFLCNLLLSELFFFISPTSTVGCILSIFESIKVEKRERSKIATGVTCDELFSRVFYLR